MLTKGPVILRDSTLNYRYNGQSVAFGSTMHGNFTISLNHYPLDGPILLGGSITMTRNDAHVLLSMKREIEAQLEQWFPGCVLPIPEDEVDPDVMREWSEMQERI